MTDYFRQVLERIGSLRDVRTTATTFDLSGLTPASPVYGTFLRFYWLDETQIVLVPGTVNSLGQPVIEIEIGGEVRTYNGEWHVSLVDDREEEGDPSSGWYYLYLYWQAGVVQALGVKFSRTAPNAQGYYTNQGGTSHDNWKCVGEVYNELEGAVSIRPFFRIKDLVFWRTPVQIADNLTNTGVVQEVSAVSAVPENHGMWGFFCVEQRSSPGAGGNYDAEAYFVPDPDVWSFSPYMPYWYLTDYGALLPVAPRTSYDYWVTHWAPAIFNTARIVHVKFLTASGTGFLNRVRVVAYARKSYKGFV